MVAAAQLCWVAAHASYVQVDGIPGVPAAAAAALLSSAASADNTLPAMCQRVAAVLREYSAASVQCDTPGIAMADAAVAAAVVGAIGAAAVAAACSAQASWFAVDYG